MAKTFGSNKVKVALIQASVSNDADSNLAKTVGFVRKAASQGASIVCLQELFTLPYFPQHEDKKYFKCAEAIPGKTSNFLSQTAKENNINLVGGSIFEKSGKKFYNTCLIFDSKGRLISKYRKVHIPYDPKFYEKHYFSPGNLGFVQAKLSNVIVSPLICYDQ